MSRTPNYEADRRNDGKKRRIGLLKCRKVARKLAPAHVDAEQLATAVVCMIVKSQYHLSYGGGSCILFANAFG
ncbi:MAG: hypothetical protein EB828_03610 [Nitrosopumilus sp. D6]|nr:MAG: hypothetical protein EB828_03610 [Nitrosopumilus sp. D6]